MDDCLFCKIIKGEIPSSKVYEDEKTYVFMDIAADVDGHMLVIPKEHCVNFLDASKEALHAVAETVQKVSKHLIDDCGYEGVNVFNCTNACAGQSVFHYHMHIVPRKGGDGLPPVPSYTGAKEEIKAVFERVKM